MELIETYPIATVCQVLDYPRSQVYYRPQAVEDESDLKGAILTLAGQHPTPDNGDAETSGTGRQP
jgi:hypothetical protein